MGPYKMKLPKHIIEKILKASRLSNQHRDLVTELDLWFIDNGYDIYTLRQDDAGGYVDSVDYGANFNIDLFLEELENYKDEK